MGRSRLSRAAVLAVPVLVVSAAAISWAAVHASTNLNPPAFELAQVQAEHGLANGGLLPPALVRTPKLRVPAVQSAVAMVSAVRVERLRAMSPMAMANPMAQAHVQPLQALQCVFLC